MSTQLADARYASFAAEVAAALPPGRVATDDLTRVAFACDASMYRMVPRVVVHVEDEHEVATTLAAARRHRTSVTFRAAGTSLSGQAVTDSVLVVAGRRAFRRLEVLDGGRNVAAGAGLTGAEVNAALAPLQRRIGPDPASLAAARIGGIVANNASGMCCRVEQNAYHTLRGVRAVLADGSVLDTRDAGSRAAFRRSRGELLDALADLGRRVRGDEALVERIRRKHAIKNTIGYGLNAFVDFADPFEILAHLLVGSEGTLAFVSEVTLATVPDPRCAACALVLYPDLATACRVASGLANAPVSAVELIDRAALRAVAGAPGVPVWIADAPGDAAALLVETRADDPRALGLLTERLTSALAAVGPLADPVFHERTEPAYASLWQVRRGLYPAVGAARQPGTVAIIEDVAVPVAALSACARDVRNVLREHGHGDAVLFGHALTGNLHFVLAARLGSEVEVRRYAKLLDALANVVVNVHGGSLKGEHGTGRNMTSYVAQEWGYEAWELMWQVKRAFDPDELLAPGVVLTRDARAHLRHLKTLPSVDRRLDACVECGFCERACPSRDVTLTPRQRIAVLRETGRRRAAGDTAGADALGAAFGYPGDATCATDGLCAVACPVGIDTGASVKALRASREPPRVLRLAAAQFGLACGTARLALRTARFGAGIVGARRVEQWTRALNARTRGRFPVWGAWAPRPGRAPPPLAAGTPRAVHFACCTTRIFGAGPGDTALPPLDHVIADLARAADLPLARPKRADSLCCGLVFESKGATELADRARDRAVAALAAASKDGLVPVVVDASPCAERLRASNLRVLDLPEWLHEEVLPHVEVRPVARTVVLHAPCSTVRNGVADAARAVARICAQRVVEPHAGQCCGWAGDRGFHVPELPAAALRELGLALPEECREGYSTSRTCEIGLALHSQRPFRSLAYLVAEAARRL